MKILLFDMDGVLLESRGYHLALQETVRRMARTLGFEDGSLSPDDIAAFEACGITCEWDEAAITTAFLLESAWKDEPNLNLPTTLGDSQTLPRKRRRLPDFTKLVVALASPEMIELHPLDRAALFFLGGDRHTANQEQILHDLILGARLAEVSLTHQTFQELVLGSSEYELSYGLPIVLDCDSFLLKFDKSNVSAADLANLKDWLAVPSQFAAVITSRPSRPPLGVFSTPEAELGMQLVGLEGIPILGWGGMCWLGLHRMTDPQFFLKPSPVHALAAMRHALGESQENALITSSGPVESWKASDWIQFDGAQICVFEDTPGGIKSLASAQSLLRKIGISVSIMACGISTRPIKVQALQRSGANIYPSLSIALRDVLK